MPGTTIEDPLLHSSKREAWVAAALWLVAMVFCVGWCYHFGYYRDDQPIRFVLGFPDWIFWGVVIPWGLSLLLSWWFSYAFMRDDDLGVDRGESGNEVGRNKTNG